MIVTKARAKPAVELTAGLHVLTAAAHRALWASQNTAVASR